jgi:hypothetical protein
MSAHRAVIRAQLAMLALSLGPVSAVAQNAATGSGFSFAVFGDSRSMMYLPYMANQEAEARDLMTDMFELVLPEKVAAGVVKKDVKLIYDPATAELTQVVMPFDTKSEVTYLSVDKGWVTEASVEDVKLLPGVRRTMFRLHGGDWVAREMVKDVQRGRAKFILSTGDLVWWGKQGAKPSDNPYWKLVYEDILKQLPPPDEQMRAAGLPGRVFTAIGNHEVWDDSDVEGVLTAFPYLKQFGLSAKQLTDRPIRLSRAHGLECDSAHVRGADEATQGVARSSQGRRDEEGLHLLPQSRVRPLRHGRHPRQPESSQDDRRLR